MKHLVRIAMLTSVSVLAMTASAVHAQTGGFYAGAALGTTSFDTGIRATTAKLDDSSTGYKIFGGFEFAPQFSVELSYANLGESKLTGNAGDQFVADGTLFQFLVNNAEIKFKTTLLGVGGRFSLPITPALDFNARLGFASWNVDISATSSSTATAVGSTSGTDLYYGAGLAWEFSPSVYLSGNYEHYDIDTQSADFLSLGITKRF